MSHSRLGRTGSHAYFRRRMAEEAELADRAPDERSREVHERAVRLFRELIRGRERGAGG